MNSAVFLEQAGQTFPDTVALSQGENDLLTYEELARTARQLATGLRERFGICPGDRVAILMENNAYYLEVIFALWRLGAVVVPINTRLHPREVAYIASDAGVRACVASVASHLNCEQLDRDIAVLIAGEHEYQELSQNAPSLLHPSRPDEAAWLFYTSGTTGRPKGAVLTHRNIIAASTSFLADAGPFEPGGSILHFAPLSHAGGFFACALTSRAYRHVIPTQPQFSTGEVCDLLRRYDRCCMFAVPTMLTRMIDDPSFDQEALENLHTVMYGGAPMYVEDLRRVIATIGGGRLWQGYGQGEAPATITHLPRWAHADAKHPHRDAILGSVGIARTGVEVRLVDDEGNGVPPGAVGEVTVRGDVVMAGYWNNAEATSSAILDGWLHTGDLGRMDEFGFLTLMDRSKDVVISGGSNVYPREVEEILLLHPDVQEVSVVGQPDPEWGEAVVAFVVTKPGTGPNEADLDAFCQANIARYKRPRRYLFVDDLPMSSVGKVLKTELRRRLDQLQTTSPG